MDFHKLVSNVLGKMKEARQIFASSSNPEEKKRVYNQFVDGVSSLNKILKGGNFGEQSKNKIREILKTSIQQAGEMKGELANLKSNGGGRGTNMSNNSGGRGTNLSNNNSSKMHNFINIRIQGQEPRSREARCGNWECHCVGKAQCEMGRCGRSGVREDVIKGSHYSALQVPGYFRGHSETMERHLVIRTPRDGEDLFGQGLCDSGQFDIFLDFVK